MHSGSLASGWGHQKGNHVIRGLGLWASLTSREGRGLETEFNNVADDLIYHAYLDCLCSGPWGLVELPGRWTYWPAKKGTCLDATRRGQRGSGFLSRLCPMGTLYHKSIIITTAVLWVLSHSSELPKLRDATGSPRIVAMWLEGLVSEMRAVLGRTESVTCRVWH